MILLPTIRRRAAPDPALLLVAWLNSLIFEMVTRNSSFRRSGLCIDFGFLSRFRDHSDKRQLTRR